VLWTEDVQCPLQHGVAAGLGPNQLHFLHDDLLIPIRQWLEVQLLDGRLREVVVELRQVDT